MKNFIFLALALFAFSSCKKDTISSLKAELEDSHTKLSDEYIIACAAGMPDGFMEEQGFPVSMFFYPVDGASNYKYYETSTDNLNEEDYSLYQEIPVESIPVFNGYLRRFQLPRNKNRWGIVTYEVEGSLRICDPVHVKVATSATVWAPDRIAISDNGVNPSFGWEEFAQFDNAIHFNVVSDSIGNLIRGTYTNDTSWSFYDLTNVTLNIRDVAPQPILDSVRTYKFTLMSVSDDNWVTTFGQKDFVTQ